MFLIRGAEVYAPEPLGRKDVLIGFGKILKIGGRLPDEYGGLEVETLDAEGCILTPGFVDQHVHVMGAGGEAGFYSRTPEMQVSAIVSHGITTVVGLHGTDGTARNIEALYAKVCALEQEGITARMLTGSFEMPSATLTGSVRRDPDFHRQGHRRKDGHLRPPLVAAVARGCGKADGSGLYRRPRERKARLYAFPHGRRTQAARYADGYYP